LTISTANINPAGDHVKAQLSSRHRNGESETTITKSTSLHSLVDTDPALVNSIISDAWKKAEEIKKEKERHKKLHSTKLISPRGTSDKENATHYNTGEEYFCNDPELKSIIDAAWVS
jgi:hypothetical protein